MDRFPKNGFALLEIVIVLGIIALLVGGGFYAKNLMDQQSAIQAGNNALDAAYKLKQTIDLQSYEQQKQIENLDATPAPATSSNSQNK